MGAKWINCESPQDLFHHGRAHVPGPVGSEEAIEPLEDGCKIERASARIKNCLAHLVSRWHLP